MATKTVPSGVHAQNISHPKRFTFQGAKYKLNTPYKIVTEDPPISVGPFYQRADDRKPLPDLYMPDLGFCAGKAKVPSFLHYMGV